MVHVVGEYTTFTTPNDSVPTTPNDPTPLGISSLAYASQRLLFPTTLNDSNSLSLLAMFYLPTTLLSHDSVDEVVPVMVEWVRAKRTAPVFDPGVGLKE